MKKYSTVEIKMIKELRKCVDSAFANHHTAYTLMKLFSFVDDDTDIIKAAKKLVSHVDDLYDSMIDDNDDVDYTEYYNYDEWTVAQIRNAVDRRMYRDITE